MTTPTVPIILCRGDEYHSAGEIFGQISTDASTTHAALVRVLTAYAGMAGNDGVGQQWAASYDQATQLAMSSSSKLVTACGQTRDLIVVGAHNHEVAEASADHRDLPAPSAPQLTLDPCLPEAVPSAASSGIPEPFGWSIVKDAVGWAWPDGHQDQLHAAETAWHTAASDFRTLAGETPSAIDLLGNQQSAEIDISVQSCKNRQADLGAIADACQTLGDSCGDYATSLDEAHHNILEELKEFAVETAAWEVGFAVAAPFTASLSEWVGNTALAGRAAAKARRIATIIAELAAKVGKLVSETIEPLVERLKPLFDKIRNWVSAAKIKLNPLGKSDSTLVDGKLFSRQGPRTNREVLESGEHLPMTQEAIAEYARRAVVDLRGIGVDIGNSPDDIRYYDMLQASASAAPGHIVLAPSAFADEETLMRNLVHERVHIEQFKEGRVNSDSGVTEEMENEAYRADEEFWNNYLSRNSGG